MSFQCTTSLPRGFDRRSHEEPWAPTRARRSFCRKDFHVVFFHERYWVVFRAICQAHIQWCHLPGRSWKCVGWGGARGRNTRSIIIIVVIIIIIVIFFFFFFLQFEYNDVKCKSFNDGLWDNEDEKTKPFGNLLSFVLSRRKNIFCYRLPSLIASHRKKNTPSKEKHPRMSKLPGQMGDANSPKVWNRMGIRWEDGRWHEALKTLGNPSLFSGIRGCFKN